MNEHRSNCGADDSAEAGGRGQPTKTLGAVVGIAGVRDIRLHDPDRSTANSLNHSREQKQPECGRVSEDYVRDSRYQKTGEQRRPATITVGEPSPQRSAGELRNRK